MPTTQPGRAATLPGVALLLLLSALPLFAAPEGPASTGFVPVPGGKLYYEARGEGPALVLIHDGLLDSVTWDGQVPALSRVFRTIRYDRRGYGRSETTTRDFSAVDDLSALLDALRVERAVVVGCSAGGGLAVDFTLAHPERVSGLVLTGAVVSGLDYSEHFYRRNLENLRPLFHDRDLAKSIAAWATDPYLTDPGSAAARQKLREVLAAHPHQVDGTLPEGKKPERPAAGRLGEIHVPTLILVGAGDIPDVQAHAGALQAGIAGSRREVLPGVGHLAHLEQPERWNAAVLAFLRPEDEAARYLESLDNRSLPYEQARRLFDYDPAAPLAIVEAKSEERAGAKIVDLSYASPLGGRVPAYLVLPRGGPEAKHPAVLFVHPGQGDRGTFLDEAVDLAGRGVVSLLIGAPSTRPGAPKRGKPWDGEKDRQELVQTAVDVRRGFDLLAARPEVDPTRLGYVGHRLGATIGGPLLALEPRVQAWVLMAGFAVQTREWAAGQSVGSIAFRNLLPEAEQERFLAALAPIDTVRFLPHAPPRPVFFQFARRDELVAPWDAEVYIRATPGEKTVTWYDTGHTFDADARQDREAWLVRQLGLGRPPAATALFDFRSGLWVNLHHFLYATANGKEEKAAIPGGPLTAEEQKTWEGAVDVYRRSYAQRDLLFGKGMAEINSTLSIAGSDLGSLKRSASLPRDLLSALEAAAPVYRAHWWPEHDAANRAWIAAIAPSLERFGPGIAERLARDYRKEWPSSPVPVDVVLYAGPVGAYTADSPYTHITLSSRDSRESGDNALETLFHEASHGWDEELIQGVMKAAKERGRPVPENLWHAILFYTAGDATRKTLMAEGIAYGPYAERNGVYDRGWKDYRRAAEIGWQPYLDGKTDFASGLRAVIDALPAEKPR